MDSGTKHQHRVTLLQDACVSASAAVKRWRAANKKQSPKHHYSLLEVTAIGSTQSLMVQDSAENN